MSGEYVAEQAVPGTIDALHDASRHDITER
jgi:hypothetical protein